MDGKSVVDWMRNDVLLEEDGINLYREHPNSDTTVLWNKSSLAGYDCYSARTWHFCFHNTCGCYTQFS